MQKTERMIAEWKMPEDKDAAITAFTKTIDTTSKPQEEQDAHSVDESIKKTVANKHKSLQPVLPASSEPMLSNNHASMYGKPTDAKPVSKDSDLSQILVPFK